MNICIKKLQTWLSCHSKAKEWLWFAALWLGGLLAVAGATYPIKLLIRAME